MMIKDIEALWPPDVTEEGKGMLVEALCRVWKSLPDEVIEALHSLEMYKANH